MPRKEKIANTFVSAMLNSNVFDYLYWYNYAPFNNFTHHYFKYERKYLSNTMRTPVNLEKRLLTIEWFSLVLRTPKIAYVT
jgi:hypothetical protein